MTFGPLVPRHGPTGVPADHFPPHRSPFVAVDHRGRITALVATGEPPGPTLAPITTESTVEECLAAIATLNGGTGVEVVEADWVTDRQAIYDYVRACLAEIRPEAVAELGEARLALDDLRLATARDNAYRWALLNQIEVGNDHPEDKARGIVSAMSPEELDDQFGPHATQHGTPQFTTRTTKVDAVDLAAKVQQLRERQRQTPDVPRMRVKMSAVGDSTLTASALWIDMAVRWDDEAFDPYKRNPDGTLGGKGAFVSTLPGASGDHAMVAAGVDVPQIVDDPGAAWHAILCVEGLRTDEDPGREIMPGACQFPDLPVSLRVQIEDEGGHWGAVVCGRIDTMDRAEQDGYNTIPATGVFGTNEHGQVAQLLVAEQTQRFISIDPRDCDIEIVEIEVSTSSSGIYYDCEDDDDDNVLYDWWVRYTNLTIGAATIVATPALQQAVIALASVELPETPIAVATAPPTSVTVTASGESTLPSRTLFEDPGFHVGDPRLVRQPDGHYACPLRVDRATGRVYGHVAHWAQNHTGLPGQNRKPPHSPTYAYFTTGARRTAEGEIVAVGNLTMGTGHASVSIRSADQARAHYQAAPAPAHYDGGFGAVQMADVSAGEDDFGIWVSGVLCDGVTEEQIRRFESLGLSGDWRTIAGRLHMVACLAVPVPGFPIAREESIVASAGLVELHSARAGIDAGNGDVFALVAAGRVRNVPDSERLAILERRVDLLINERAEEVLKDLTAIL